MRAQITHARSLLVRSPYVTFLPIWSNQRSKGTASSASSVGAAAAAGCDDEDEEEGEDEDTDGADDTAAGAEDDPCARASVLSYVVGFARGKLLIVHGMLDENVHFSHSTALEDAIKAASARRTALGHFAPTCASTILSQMATSSLFFVCCWCLCLL